MLEPFFKSRAEKSALQLINQARPSLLFPNIHTETRCEESEDKGGGGHVKHSVSAPWRQTAGEI